MSNSLRSHGLQPARLLCPWRFSRQEYCSRLPFPPLGDLPNPGIQPPSPALQADSLPSEPPENMCPNPRATSPDSQPQLPHPEMRLSGHLRGAAERAEYSKADVEEPEPHVFWGRWPGMGVGWMEEGGMRLVESALFINLDPGLRLYIHCRFNSV